LWRTELARQLFKTDDVDFDTYKGIARLEQVCPSCNLIEEPRFWGWPLFQIRWILEQ
jgi:hypothetical protein